MSEITKKTKKTKAAVPRSVSTSRKATLAALSALMPVEKAKVLAGYSSKTSGDKLMTQEMRETASQIRERLQHTEGYRLEDSAKFYKGISETKKHAVSDRLRSRARLDTILGHEAPARVEINETRELTQAVMILSNLPINPQTLAGKLTQYTDISNAQSGHSGNALIHNGLDGQGN